MMREFAIPNETRKHRQRVIGEGLIDERFLPLKRFNRTARWKVVRIVEKRRDDLREQFRNGGEACQAFCDCGHSSVARAQIARHPRYCRGPANRRAL